jgi:hypothetical protein
MHNLDEGIQEHFEFTVKGHKYKFRHLNTEEMEQIAKLDTDNEKAKQYLYTFITKVDEGPEFSDVSKQMIAPQWRKFHDMIKAEMGIK